jgi:hypothetical protein
VTDGAQTGSGARLPVGRILLTGMAITGTGAILGVIVGALADGEAGFWMFIGMGAGALIAVGALALGVVRRL